MVWVRHSLIIIISALLFKVLIKLEFHLVITYFEDIVYMTLYYLLDIIF